MTTLRAAFGLSVALSVALSSPLHADAEGAGGVGPSDEILLDEPSVVGLINNGDQSTVETVYIYMDGCPIVSITPPESGRGRPQVTMIEPTGECVAGRGTQDPADLVGTGAPGMLVQLWKDDPALLDPIGEEAETAQATSLVVEIASLYPREEATPTSATGPGTDQPGFFIPGPLGDPSGDLLLASGGPNSGGTVFGGGSPNFITGTGGPGGSGSGGGGGGGLFGGPGGSEGTGPITNLFSDLTGGGNLPSVTAVPLPATLLLMLWALQLLRSYVRRS
ncbi:hypothetical protein [Meridianimarinicoccus roseus]|uniref:hypothetical protein n=1 Tax=Meridianimarinicoccus roseus TaxID=2072018 RepID=UPI0011B276A7|nr:hypothetical protein [Meridianimarinicoccus roseus]